MNDTHLGKFGYKVFQRHLTESLKNTRNIQLTENYDARYLKKDLFT